MREGLLQQLGHVFLHVDSIGHGLHSDRVEERGANLVVLYQIEDVGQDGGVHCEICKETEGGRLEQIALLNNSWLVH